MMEIEINDWLPEEQTCIMIYRLNKCNNLNRPEVQVIKTASNRLPVSHIGNEFCIDETKGMASGNWNGFKIGNAVLGQQYDFLLIAYEYDKNDSSFINGGLRNYWKTIPWSPVQNNYFDLPKFLEEANYTILLGNDKLNIIKKDFDDWFNNEVETEAEQEEQEQEPKEIEFTDDFEQIKKLTENKAEHQGSLF